MVALSSVLLVLNNQQKKKKMFCSLPRKSFRDSQTNNSLQQEQAQQLPLRRRPQHALPKRIQTTFAQLRRLPEGFLHRSIHDRR